MNPYKKNIVSNYKKSINLSILLLNNNNLLSIELYNELYKTKLEPNPNPIYISPLNEGL